jgi:hypothetical protein
MVAIVEGTLQAFLSSVFVDNQKNESSENILGRLWFASKRILFDRLIQLCERGHPIEKHSLIGKPVLEFLAGPRIPCRPPSGLRILARR